ncbi:DUF4407 domain-containing protein [Dehalococcoidia bacterium]|nr:DUF4407 domain-containing protein [Dehalococcoidia bacterium]
MAILVAIIIALSAITIVFAPIIRRRLTKVSTTHQRSSQIRELLDKRDELINSLRDLDHDLALGNVSDALYEALRSEYEAEAINTLKSLDARSAGLDQQIEAEIADLNIHSGNSSESTKS